MIIVKLMGGLGNQLFQYAAGRAIAERKGVPLKLDLAWFATQELRSYRLEHFNISAKIANPSEIAAVKGENLEGFQKRIFTTVQQLLPYYKRRVIQQQSRLFDANVFKADKQVYLMGYWQSEKYFQDIEPIIRSEFTVKAPPTSRNNSLAQKIRRVEAISLHVRRGDYVTNPRFQETHGAQPLQYYYEAIEEVTQIIKSPHFFVFSDDPEWAQEELKMDFPVTYVAHNGPAQGYEDIHLMSLCDHHIVANSSFSWWGAWLCENPEKIVVAPKKWFNDPTRDTSDLIPDKWMRL